MYLSYKQKRTFNDDIWPVRCFRTGLHKKVYWDNSNKGSNYKPNEECIYEGKNQFTLEPTRELKLEITAKPTNMLVTYFTQNSGTCQDPTHSYEEYKNTTLYLTYR